MGARSQFLLSLLLCLWAGQGQTQFYRCSDENGVTLYQATECPMGQQSSLSVVTTYQPATGLRPSERRWLKQRERQHRQAQKKSRRRSSSQDPRKQEKRCWKKQQQLDAVSSKLRRGYKPAKGDRLRARRRSYEDYLRKFCG